MAEEDPDLFASEVQAHSAGLTRPHEPSQQSGIHHLHTEIHPRFVPVLAHAVFEGSEAKRGLLNFVLLSSFR